MRKGIPASTHPNYSASACRPFLDELAEQRRSRPLACSDRTPNVRKPTQARPPARPNRRVSWLEIQSAAAGGQERHGWGLCCSLQVASDESCTVQPLATSSLATLPQEVLTRVCLPPAAAATLLLRRPQCVTHAALGIRAAASASAAGDGLVGLLLRLLLLRSRTARQPACRRTEQQVCVVGGERRRRRHQPEM